jgi:hypothetical protein
MKEGGACNQNDHTKRDKTIFGSKLEDRKEKKAELSEICREWFRRAAIKI